ncbi:MFS transporter [Bradyrhizobium viridifuturi]|uniref:MFS transporter n=1 Tax=Bradyrhizobium viridifuturi TaxID=1654716 RepID=UPI00067F726F|nr:MFS transporter [Bradyrhizobium viridifuturi]
MLSQATAGASVRKEASDMKQAVVQEGWRSLLKREWIPTLAILLGGVLLQSMNVLMLTTVLPSIVGELGGVAMLSWPTTAYLASSIVAASCVGVLSTAFGARRVYCGGVVIFGLGAVLCSLAPAMGWVVAGRLIQGFGGGLEAAVAYVLVRATFPERMWSRTIAVMSMSWSMSVLIGPLVGGLFAHFASWRGAFVASAVSAVVLAIAAFFVLSPAAVARPTSAARMPLGRVALICLAIAATSVTSAVGSSWLKLGLIVTAILAFVAMLRLDRTAPTRLLPSDAFSWRSGTGIGLWVALLLCVTFSPLQIYVPMFLQQLHGFDPLSAGFAVACASMGWSVASILTAGVSSRWADRLMLIGPAMMGASLMAIALLGPNATASVVLLIPAIALLGAGIGQCWPLVAHRIMDSARPGDEVVAASSVPTIQQMGFAFGAAIAGLVANASGLAAAVADATMERAAFWVPASFVAWAMLAFVAGLRLRALRRRG